MRTLLRVVTGLFAIGWWIVPGMGLIDLSVSWDGDWPVVLEAGWGLLCTIGLGIPLVLAAARPALARAAATQLWVVAAALAVGVVASVEPQAWWFFALLAVQLVLLHLVVRGAEAPPAAGRSRALLVLAAVGAPGWLAYAWSMAAANRELHFDGDITMGVDHYAVQAALGVALVALPAVAGLGWGDHRLLGTTAAVAAGYLGLVAYSWEDMQADLGDGWSVAAMAWATTVLLAAWWPTAAAVRAARALPEQSA